MRKYLFLLTVIAICLSFQSVAAAEKAPRAPSPPAGGGTRLSIIATTFPIYDWTCRILGNQRDRIELIQLQDNGVDLHNYQPTVQEIAKISHCDLFLYVGGESDEWVKKALRTSRNPRRIALNLMQKLGNAVREEKPLEGMEEHHAEEHEHHKEHAHHHGHHDDDHENDEHIWLSLRCAATLCKSIADSLSALDAEHAAEYQANCREYTARLLALDREYAKAVEASSRRTLLFADRFPFRYLADDYGLTCFAAFSGCSSESEASFKTIAFLAAKANELKLPAVLVLEGRTHKIAETVVRTAGRKELRILVMDSLQSSTTRDAARGKSYLTAMEKNLEVLKKALDSNM